MRFGSIGYRNSDAEKKKFKSKKKSPDHVSCIRGLCHKRGYVHTEEELINLLADSHNPLITIKYYIYRLSLYKYKDFSKLNIDINVIH